jgi:hypothetical protein
MYLWRLTRDRQSGQRRSLCGSSFIIVRVAALVSSQRIAGGSGSVVPAWNP